MIATTRAALLRGTPTEDALGDELDDNAVAVEAAASWTETRRNIIPNPTLALALDNWAWTVYDATREVDGLGDFQTYIKGVRASSNAAALRAIAGTAMFGNGATISLRALVSSSLALPGFQVTARPNVGSATGQSLLAAFTLPVGDTLIELPGVTSFAGNPGALSGVAFVAPLQTFSTGSVLKISGVDVELAPSIPDYLDGDGANSTIERRRWLGAPSASPSVLEIASAVAKYDDFPISIIETSRREYDEASNVWRSVRYHSGRVSSRVPVEAGDRIRDNRDGAIYTVSEVEREARGLSGRSSVTLTMKRTAP